MGAIGLCEKLGERLGEKLGKKLGKQLDSFALQGFDYYMTMREMVEPKKLENK